MGEGRWAWPGQEEGRGRTPLLMESREEVRGRRAGGASTLPDAAAELSHDSLARRSARGSSGRLVSSDFGH
jgi:hypothetical protein